MHEPSASTKRSTKRYNHPKASRVAGKMTLPQFLEGYERIKLGDACRAAPIRSRDLAVWVNSTGVWTQVDAQKLWGRRGNESLCRTLIMRLLGMSQAQYNSMKDAFEDDNAPELIGIYRNGANKYAIVVRLPTDNKVWRGGAMVGVGLTGLAVGALSSKVNFRGTPSAAVDLVVGITPDPEKWLSAFQKFIKDAHVLAALSAPIRAAYQSNYFQSMLDALERQILMYNKSRAEGKDFDTHAIMMQRYATHINNNAANLKSRLQQKPFRDSSLLNVVGRMIGNKNKAQEIGEIITPVIDRVAAGYSEIKEHSSNWHEEDIKMRVDDLIRYFQLENGVTLEKDET